MSISLMLLQTNRNFNLSRSDLKQKTTTCKFLFLSLKSVLSNHKYIKISIFTSFVAIIKNQVII